MSRYYEKAPLKSLSQILDLATQHRKIVVFTCASCAPAIESVFDGSDVPVLSAFQAASSPLGRNTLLFDANLTDRVVTLLPTHWTNGYRLEGVSAIVFAGVSVNRISRLYRQTILRASAPKVDIYFVDCRIQPESREFDREFIFGASPHPIPAFHSGR